MSKRKTKKHFWTKDIVHHNAKLDISLAEELAQQWQNSYPEYKSYMARLDELKKYTDYWR